MDNLVNGGLQSQNSFGTWINNVISDTPPCSLEASTPESSIRSSVYEPFSSLEMDTQQSSLPEQVFNLTEVSPSWASSTEKTKVLFLFLLICLIAINYFVVIVSFFATKCNTTNI